MATIILNESSFSLNSFNRNTSFSEEAMNSYAYCNINYNQANSESLYSVAEDPITSIVIKNSDNETIYSLENIEAHITNIDESLNGETISVNININF